MRKDGSNIPPEIGTGSRRRILEYLLKNVGRVLSSDEIRKASGGVSEWARRLRELRDEYGYQVLSHKDRANLKPGQYHSLSCSILKLDFRYINTTLFDIEEKVLTSVD